MNPEDKFNFSKFEDELTVLSKKQQELENQKKEIAQQSHRIVSKKSILQYRLKRQGLTDDEIAGNQDYLALVQEESNISSQYKEILNEIDRLFVEKVRKGRERDDANVLFRKSNTGKIN